MMLASLAMTLEWTNAREKDCKQTLERPERNPDGNGQGPVFAMRTENPGNATGQGSSKRTDTSCATIRL